jgi:hypothetical protein
MQQQFQPTYLYIKRHKITGLLYLGKTNGTEKYLLEEYNGSGRYWNQHLTAHGKEVETIWYCLFTEKNKLINFALKCSIGLDIVNSRDSTGKKIWANLKYENGVDGGAWNKGISGYRRKKNPAQIYRTGPQSQETCRLKREKLTGLKRSANSITNLRHARSLEDRTGANNANAKSYLAVAPDGTKFLITNGGLNQFCNQHNLSFYGMKRLAREKLIGKRGLCNGWKCLYN